MEEEFFFGATYNGSKQFAQADFPTTSVARFDAAAGDYMELGIDLNEQLIMNKPATFFFRMNGDSMQDAGIHPGDVLIVDRSIRATNGKIIIAAVDGELLIRRYRTGFNKQSLCAENRRYKNIEITEFTEFNAWGVVTSVIHLLDPALIVHSKTNKDYDHKGGLQ